jgi:hypothetical protein
VYFRPVLHRLRKFISLRPEDRRGVLRRRVDYGLGVAVFAGIGGLANRLQRFAYLSYVPDSIRAFGARPDLDAAIASWTYKNRRRNAGDIGRMLFLLQNAEKLISEGVPGDFAELGVYKGNSAKLLASVLAESDDRKLHLFDTFGGFDPRDLSGVDADQAVLFTDVSLERVRDFVGHQAVCEYWPGYFPESAGGVDLDATFAFVHLDLDLYAPMKAGLEFFYPRMPPGGLMVLHDYSSGHWPGTTKAVDEFLAHRVERLVLMPDTSGTAIFRKV